MKLKEFLSLFRTMPGGVSSFNNEDAKKAAKIRIRLDRTSASSDEGESRSNRADMPLDDGEEVYIVTRGQAIGMKLKEFLSLFRTTPGDISSLNIKNLRDDMKVHICSNSNPASSDKEEPRSDRRCHTFFDEFD